MFVCLRIRTQLAGTRLAAWACVVACAPLVAPPAARAYCRLSTGNPSPGAGEVCIEEGRLLRWATPCVGHSVYERPAGGLSFEETRSLIAASFETWRRAPCGGGEAAAIDLAQTDEVTRCAGAGHTLGEPDVNTIAVYDDWAERELPLEAFGVTLVWHEPETGEVFGADMLLNDETMGRLSDCPDAGCSRGQVDLRNVVTHEAGHFLGLSHSGVEESTMHFEATPREVSKRELADDDREGLCSLYPSDSAGTDCSDRDFAPEGGLDRRCTGSDRRVTCTVGPPTGGTHGATVILLAWLLGAFGRLRRRESRHRGLPRRARKQDPHNRAHTRF